MDKLIQMHNVSAGYDGKTVISQINLTVFEQDFLGIIGPNGGGKTTLLKVILGLLKPVSGEITFYSSGKEKKTGYMPQTTHMDKKFPIMVSEIILSGLMSENLSKQAKIQKMMATSRKMGLENILSKPVGSLSGGQLQRVLLARAVINDPPLLILDEPNSYVDKHFEHHFYEYLQEINHETAIILVSHDIGTVVSNVKNIACVNETLHYHPGTDIEAEWLEAHFACPFDLVGHGAIPHRVLKEHVE